MSNIFARSPYVIEIDEASQLATKLELFIWNGTGSAPSSPQYTFSKSIPASNNTATNYNISPYIREYFNHITPLNPTSKQLLSSATALTTLNWCNVMVKRYKDIGAGYVLVDSTTYFAFDGFGYYTEGYNYDNGNYLRTQKAYTYASGVYAGYVVAYLGVNWRLEWDDGTTTHFDSAVTTAGWYAIPLNYLGGTTGSWTLGIFRQYEDSPIVTYSTIEKNECKYTPITCDFVNKYGMWQREFFFKASNDTLNISTSKYNVMPTDNTDWGDYPNYSIVEGQSRTFNVNGKESIKVNTDWVDEDWKNNLKELMLSERILINSKPASLNTKSTELFKHINTKMINYTLEFEFDYNIINNVM